jgi:AcrR family transcriptional regulator
VTRSRPLRADAEENRGRILAAARDVFVELGPGAPLEEISRRAGTGIATLYRRFPDRAALMQAVVREGLEQAAVDARSAADEEPDPFEALRRYVHSALDSRVAAVIPALLDAMPPDDSELAATRTESARLLEQLVDAAQRAGKLRQDITAGDIGTFVVRLARPLPGPLPRDVDAVLAHRHADLLLDGLRARSDGALPLSGPAMTFSDLQRAGTETAVR